MLSHKMIIFLGLLGLESFLGCYWYVHGRHGLRETEKLRESCRHVEASCAELVTKINSIKQELIDWEQDPQYREIYAREHLHMGRAHETWYRY